MRATTSSQSPCRTSPGADLGTSSATGTIRNRRVTPLTASVENVRSEHSGAGTTFPSRLRFSETFQLSCTVLRDDGAFQVTGGKVDKARRVDGRDDLRGSTSSRYSDRPVTVRLPATTDCNATDATCTDDGRPLSNSSSATIAEPVGISVDDAEAVAAADAVPGFGVTLSRAASRSLTIDYATSDGTASAGSDYTATSGTLTISIGTSPGTIKVAVLDGSHDDAGDAGASPAGRVPGRHRPGARQELADRGLQASRSTARRRAAASCRPGPERQHAVSRDVRRLLVHQAEGFAESGLSISVSYYPTPRTPLGFTARVAPAGGDAQSGTWPGSGTGASA